MIFSPTKNIEEERKSKNREKNIERVRIERKRKKRENLWEEGSNTSFTSHAF